jgi:putative tryptophan/tyrosine transport system substrate-binding protein
MCDVLSCRSWPKGEGSMRRREFIMLVGGAAAARPARAQQPTMPVIGFLSSRSPNESSGVVAAFRAGLGETGFSEGRNVTIAFRWAEGRYDRLSGLASELVDLKVAVLFAAGGPPSALAAKTATSTIPVVFSAVNDPEHIGLIASLNRPGGNVTGMSMLTSGVAAKSVELLKELVPSATVFGYLVNPLNPTAEIYASEATVAANNLKIAVQVLKASSERDLEDAFAALATLKATGIVVPGEPFFDSQRDTLTSLAAQYKVPAIYAFREYVSAGGLMSYGASLPDSYRRAAIYVGRILKGAKPADLPVMQPTKFDLIINLKTAKALGLAIPDRLLALADEVIE